jgi:hypothetical protein
MATISTFAIVVSAAGIRLTAGLPPAIGELMPVTVKQRELETE